MFVFFVCVCVLVCILLGLAVERDAETRDAGRMGESVYVCMSRGGYLVASAASR